MSTWGEWNKRTDDHASAYVDWEVGLLERFGLSEGMHMVEVPSEVSDQSLDLGRLLAILEAVAEPNADQPGSEVFPVPRRMANPKFANGRMVAEADTEGTDRPDVDRLNENTVVVGVIDLDIGIGHSRFRNSDGSSRVLAAWQQGADWSERQQTHLPFGQELHQNEITKLVHECGSTRIGQPLDQEMFYRKIGLIQHDRIEGMGSLGQTAAHGTHVVGLAGGADPISMEDALFRDDVRMIVANLPHPCCFGEGGAFLDYYLTYALRWIIETNNKISQVSEKKPDFPLFINISFGKQAGARGDGRTFLGELIKTNVEARSSGGEPPTVFVPAGNDNLARCHTHMYVETDEPRELEWRIQPDDGTSNFLEIWVENEYTTSEIESDFKGAFPLLIDVIPPGMTEESPQEPTSPSFCDLLSGLGRIYCDILPSNGDPATSFSRETGDSGEDNFRLRYLICLSPNGVVLPGEPMAPAGKYRVRLINQQVKEKKLSVVAKIQTDEATIQTFRNAKRSYFEHAAYQMFESDGRPADTYKYTGDIENRFDQDRDDSPIKRHGTMNSYATTNRVAAIGGYRLSDGRPADYSGSGLGPWTQRKIVNTDGYSRLAPTAAFPSDDGCAHFGILSDGAQDGSVVALRGTSFACALATRYAVEAFLEDRRNNNKPKEIWHRLQESADRDRPHRAWITTNVDPEKTGRGRIIPQPNSTRVERLKVFQQK